MFSGVEKGYIGNKWINGLTATIYFELERGTKQGDPISAYLFILVLEIKENKNIKGINIFLYIYSYILLTLMINIFCK